MRLKIWIPILFVLMATACVGPSQEQSALPSQPVKQESSALSAVALDDLGPAPELTNEVWLNTDKPLRLEDLRGQVVLLEMWTFG